MLYLIATPIGNLKDISLRAIEVLEQVDVLLCEDTRKTGVLLKNLGVANKPRLVSFYDEVEQQKVSQVIEMLKEGLDVGLVTNAGTPLISDPGWLLVKRCQDLGLKYTLIPGASAVINALVLSGVPIARFCFLGFLPKKQNDLKKILIKYYHFEGAKVAYESPLRLKNTVKIIRELFGNDLKIKIIKEMTKVYEEILSPEEVFDAKGEVVIVFY